MVNFIYCSSTDSDNYCLHKTLPNKMLLLEARLFDKRTFYLHRVIIAIVGLITSRQTLFYVVRLLYHFQETSANTSTFYRYSSKIPRFINYSCIDRVSYFLSIPKNKFWVLSCKIQKYLSKRSESARTINVFDHLCHGKGK